MNTAVISHLPRFDAALDTTVERFPHRTVYAGRYVVQRSHFGEWLVSVITRDDGVRETEPVAMVPDRDAAEHLAEQWITTNYASKEAA